MSRSYKKIPIVKDHCGGRTGKKFANKAVRRKKDNLLKGKEYKKIYESWDINDYINYFSKEAAIEEWEDEKKYPEYQRWRHKKYGTLEKWLNHWEKLMIRK